jgi:hypothetical protein
MPLPSGQIVRLTQARARLYGEVIDHITSRDMLWVRPLLLVSPWPESEVDITITSQQVQDLREESHLLWPSALFAAVLDTEILPLLPYLYNDKPQAEPSPETARHLRQFIGQVWEQQWGDSCGSLPSDRDLAS